MTQRLKNSRLQMFIAVTTYILLHLLIQHFTSGVPSHYLLQDSSMPLISNWWGALILPVLTWSMCTLLNRKHGSVYPRHVWIKMASAGIYALAMSALFYAGYAELLSIIVLPSILVLALFFPIYGPAYVLGYVLVSSVGFGAVIPLMASLIFAVIGFIVYRGVRPALLYVLVSVKALTKP